MIQKIKNWKRLVERLKSIPAFGIHGTKYQNLDGIMREIEKVRGVFGHYLSASGEDKRLSDDEFYQRLFASVHTAQGYSRAYKAVGPQIAI